MNNKFSLVGETILIVGGAGFVGSNLTLKILEHDPHEIIIVDNLLSSERRKHSQLGEGKVYSWFNQ